MADEQARIASAYILVKARRDDRFREDARAMGEEAGKEYEKGFERGSAPSAASRGRHAREGREIGATVGTAAGTEAGTRISDGITTGLVRNRSRRAKDGETVGQTIGDAAGAAAGRRTASGITEGLARSRGDFERTGRAVGAVLGASAGKHATDVTRRAVRRELDFERRTLAAAEQAAYREASQRARADAAIVRARERDAARAARAAARARQDYERAIDAFQKRAQRAGDTISAALSRGLTGGGGGIAAKAGSILGIGALTSSASSLGGVIAGTVGAVTQLSGAVGLLPGGLAAAGIAAATLKLGILGLDEAFKNTDDPKKYAEALAALPKPAREFVRAVVALKPQVKDLRKEITGALFRDLGKDIGDLGDRYLPKAEKGFTRVAKSINFAARDTARYLDTAKAGRLVSGIFTDTGLAASYLGRTLRPVVASLLDITSVGTSLLPGLTEQLGRAAVRLQAFTDRSRRDGSMKAFFEGGIQGAKDLGRAVGNAGRILGGILKAGGGPNTSALAGLADILGRVADQVGRPEFQGGLARVFAAIRTAGDAVGDSLPRVADGLIALAPAIGRIVEGAGTALASILTTAGDAAIALAPALNTLAGAFQSIAPHAGAIVVGLLAVKGALLAVRVAAAAVEVLSTYRTRLDSVGEAAGKASTKVGGLGGAIGLASKAATAFAAYEIGTHVFGAFTKGADASAVSAGRLTEALKRFQSGTDTGKIEGVGRNFADLGKQLEAAADPSLVRRVSDVQGKVASKLTSLLTGGKSDGSRKGGFFSIDSGVSASGGKAATLLAKQLKEADGYLAGLVSSGNGAAAGELFEKLNAQAVAGGASVGEFSSKLPQFTAALSASGGSLDATRSKVQGLGKSLSDLTRETSDYADKALAARGSSRAYQSALDTAKEAAQRNGKTLRETSKAGRENAEALDAIAASGIRYAQGLLNSGSSEQAFQSALKQTRSDLIAAGVRFGLTKSKAIEYANSVLNIPKRASTSIVQYGIQGAIINAELLADRLSRIPRKVISTVQTQYLESFASEVNRDNKRSANYYRPKKGKGNADGGLIPRGLGGPRQDNIPSWLSSGEFVVRAAAVSAPGVEELLKRINAYGRMPGFADGGLVGGWNDLTARPPTAAPAPPPSTGQGRLHPDDIAALAAALGSAVRQQRIYLDSGQIAGAVVATAGRMF